MNRIEQLCDDIQTENLRLNDLWALALSMKPGETLQYKTHDGWMDWGGDISLSASVEYRIKPKPREIYASFEDGRIYAYSSDPVSGIGNQKFTKFIEVME